MIEFEVKIEGCRGGLFFKDDIYRSGETGAIDFITILLCEGYGGTINGIQYVMDYQYNTAVPHPKY